MNQTPHDRTQFIIGIVGFLGVLALVIFFKPAPETVVPPSGEPSAPVAAKWPSTFVKDATIVDTSGKPYTINVTYPITQSETINTNIKSFVEGQVATFKTDTSWATEPGADSASVGELSLIIEYKNTKATHADNYVFTTGQYTGGAHGLQVTTTFVYDENGLPITLANLFTNGEKALPTIATYVQAQLAKGEYSDANWYKDGAAPTAQNYRNFMITDGGVTFIFDPYQVAPYAAGKVQITVPVSVFKTVANKTVFPQ